MTTQTAADIHAHRILILDFGAQYTQLIARRVRELSVYSEIHPFNLPLARIRELAPRGIILSGGPASCYDEGAPKVSAELFELGIPILGICYGVQLASLVLGGISSFKPLAGVETRVAADGLLAVRSAAAMQGYYGKAAETARVLADGWWASKLKL